jgi:hypothetical protein
MNRRPATPAAPLEEDGLFLPADPTAAPLALGPAATPRPYADHGLSVLADRYPEAYAAYTAALVAASPYPYALAPVLDRLEAEVAAAVPVAHPGTPTPRFVRRVRTAFVAATNALAAAAALYGYLGEPATAAPSPAPARPWQTAYRP